MRAGYQPLPEPPGYTLDARHLRRYHEYSLVHPVKLIRCELQWSVMETPYSFPPLPVLERWRSNLATIALAGREIPVLRREATALVLAVHGAKHLWERLAWLADIAALMRQTVDWELVQAEAQILGVERLLGLSLYLAAELLDAPLPTKISWNSQPAIDQLAAQALDFLLREQIDYDAAPAARNLFLIGGLDRLHDRLLVSARFAPRLLQPWQLYRRHGLDPLRRMFNWQRSSGKPKVAIDERRAP
ncbi:MAG: nucleotidyltransferase family protein [Oscillochloris sp.]|nr:nucleotidyltransferase family protein [Oscillochloris sp.]